MYLKTKYIITEDGIPVLFGELGPSHAEVARALFPGRTIVGAGFCYIRDDRYVCYGESISLRVASRNDVDSRILNRQLGVEEL